MDPTIVIEQIRHGFARTTRPPDPFLVGSREGCEPREVVGAFFGKQTWDGLEPEMLDGNYDALSFFSEAGFRFFLPAFLIADVQGQLKTADPVHHLASTFHAVVIDVPAGGQTFRRRAGPAVLLNPQRHGAITFGDYARFRLSAFNREEAQAIVVYLQYRRSIDADHLFTADIDAALDGFWLQRAAGAPSAAELERHLQEERAFFDALVNRER